MFEAWLLLGGQLEVAETRMDVLRQRKRPNVLHYSDQSLLDVLVVESCYNRLTILAGTPVTGKEIEHATETYCASGPLVWRRYHVCRRGNPLPLSY
jgi:hypothetical protein